MADLRDYVGTGSRVGRRLNIWQNAPLPYGTYAFSIVGNGSFTELTSNRVNFTGPASLFGRDYTFVFRVVLLSDTRCNVTWNGTDFNNIPYQIINNQFEAERAIGYFSRQVFQMSRYNQTETRISVISDNPGNFFEMQYHLQPE